MSASTTRRARAAALGEVDAGVGLCGGEGGKGMYEVISAIASFS